MPKKSMKKEPVSTRPKYRTFFAAWRIYRGLTQEELADRMGTNKIRVSLKERDLEAWDMDYLESLSKALKVEKQALIFQDPQELHTSPEGEAWLLLDSLSDDARAKAVDYMRTLQIASRASKT